MKTFSPELIVASALLSSASLATAHQVEDTASSSLLHYLTSPDHMAVFCLLMAAGVTCLLRYRRRTISRQQH